MFMRCRPLSRARFLILNINLGLAPQALCLRLLRRLRLLCKLSQLHRQSGLSLNTPKALASFSPGFELARTLGYLNKYLLTLKGFANHEPLQGFVFRQFGPGFSPRSNPGLSK